MAEKTTEGIGWGQPFKKASRFLLFSPSFPGYRPGFPRAFRGPRRRVENVRGAHFEAQRDYDRAKPIIPVMFPGCIHGKEKD